MISLNHEMVGGGFLSGFTIAFTIRSVDRSLSSRLTPPCKLVRNTCLSCPGIIPKDAERLKSPRLTCAIRQGDVRCPGSTC